MTTPAQPSASADGLDLQRYTRSELAHALIYIKGQRLNMDDYPMFRAIYDGDWRSMLLMTSRQVGKSTTLSGYGIVETLARPHFQTIFVTPSGEQTRRFSTLKVGKMIQYSPFVKKYFVGEDASNRVLLRQFSNGAEMAFSYAMEDADRVRGLSGDRACFDRAAEVLTRRGWVPVHALTRQDEVADVGDDGVVEWNHPSAIIRKRHTGEMVTFRHGHMSVRVTGDHRMWANYRVKTSPHYKTPDRYEFVEATELAHTPRMGFRFSGVAKFRLDAPAEFRLPGAPGAYGAGAHPLLLPSEAFAELLGWYLSEGHLVWRWEKGVRRGVPRMVITQNEGRYASEIEACLNRCGLSYRVDKRVTVSAKNRVRSVRCTFYVHAPQLGQYATQFGKARDKFIPEEFFEYPGLLPHLLRSLYLGDASYHRGQGWEDGTLKTRSRKLADSAHRAWALLGRAAAVHTRQVPKNPESPPEPMYEVAAHSRPDYVFWRSEFQPRNRVAVESVNGEEVFCFTVKNHRPIIRGGFGQMPVVTGQCLDEYQDLLPDAIEPVIEECLRQSKHRYMMRCGTPKTNENAIQAKWEESTQSEWIIPCFGCNKWNAIRSEKYFSPKGPICKNCGRLINPRHGKWLDFKPGAPIKGFHISRACMPESVPICWNEGTRERAEAEMAWADVWVHLGGPDPYPISMFRNEVIGVSDSVGQRLVTIETLRKLCVASRLELPFPADRLQGIGRIAVGIDWSGGGVNQVSRTVVAVVGLTAKGKKRLLFYKIFPGANPHDEFTEVLEILSHFDRLGVIGCDMGEGHMYSDMLRKTYGGKVKKIAYSSAGYYAAWNPVGEFLSVNRTRALDSLMMSFNTEEWEFPKDDPGMEIVFADILAEYVEVTKVGNKVWRHSPTKPDDALHALSFARVAVQLATGELDLTAHPMTT